MRPLHLVVRNTSEIHRIQQSLRESENLLEFLRVTQSPLTTALQDVLAYSKSQIFQEAFVCIETAFKRTGFFVEFGAADGLEFSNTYSLEKSLGWNGILAEPARGWHSQLQINRACQISTDSVWSRSNELLEFSETENPVYSTLQEFRDKDFHSVRRRSPNTYKVKTISLVDLLDSHGAPYFVDYLSIDTEGSEFDILEPFDFKKYRFNVITVEHNFTPAREKIHSLLSSHNYVRKYEKLSQFDDWYVWNGNK